MKQVSKQLVLLCAVFFLSACGGQAKESDALEVSYQAEYSDASSLAEHKNANICIADRKIYFVGSVEGSDAQALYVSGGEDGYKSKELLISFPEGEAIFQFIISEEGEIYIAGKDSSEEMFVGKYDLQGTCEWQKAIEQDIMFVTDMLINGEGDVIVASDDLLMQYTKEGERKGVLEVPGSRIQSLCMSESGKVFLYLQSGKGMELVEAKLKEAALGSEIPLSDRQRVLNSDKGIYMTEGEGLYKYNEEKGEFEKSLVLTDLYIDGASVNMLAADGDGYIVCFFKEGALGELEIAFINEKNTAETEEPSKETVKSKIRFATASADSTYSNAIVAFNRSNSQYEIVIPKYSGDSERSELIKLSFLTDEAPDIVELTGGFSQDSYFTYVQGGYLADLTGYMEQSSKVKKSDFLPEVVDIFTVDGKVYGLPAYFTIDTLACPTEALEGADSWTIEEFLDFIERYPNSRSIQYAEEKDIKTGILQICMMKGIKAFVDWENGGASFEGERFKEILKRIRQLEVYTTNEDNETRSLNGEVLISCIRLSSTRNLQQAEWRNGHGNSLTLIGYPSGDEETQSGGIAFYSSQLGINGQTKEPEGAWSFVEGRLGAALKGSDSGFPTGKTAFEDKLKEETEVIYMTDDEGNYILDEKGEKIENVSTFEGVPYPAITQRQVDEVRRAVETIFPYSMEEREVIGMLMEEAAACFDKSKSVDDVADIIQNRVELYLNEKR